MSSDYTNQTDQELKEVLQLLKDRGHLHTENITVDEGSWWNSEERQTVDVSIKNHHHRPAQLDLAMEGILPAGVNALNIGLYVERAEKQLDSTPEGREVLGELSPDAPDASADNKHLGR